MSKKEENKKHAGYVVILYNFKGGAGKTTISLNLAMALHLRGKKVLLIDADEQCSSTSYCIGHEVVEGEFQQTMYDVVQSRAALPVAVSQRGLHFVPSSNRLSNANGIIKEARFGEKIIYNALQRPFFDMTGTLGEIDRYSYDYILIDCPPRSGELVVSLMVASDGLLIASIPSSESVKRIASGLGIRRTIEEDAASDPDCSFSAPAYLGIVLTRTGRCATIYKNYEELTFAKFPQVFKETIRENKDIEVSQGLVTDVFDRDKFKQAGVRPNDKATDDFIALANRFEKVCAAQLSNRTITQPHNIVNR